ncbi:MAG TPA: universal stress protein [Steroidobacteraceae bacterium]|nr:universal stress protein [Steroidobacteraceae bacterium]
MPVLKRILVGTDFSAAGRRAVMRAGQLAQQWEANLFLAHVRPDWNLFSRWRPASRDSYQDVAHGSEAPLRRVLAELESRFGVHARCDSRLGKASHVISALVGELDPHLLVIGARGEHEACAPGPCLGGTAMKLLVSVESPILLVRRDCAARYASAVVAVDAPSALSRRAVLWGSGLVGDGDCSVLHAYEVPYVERMRLQEVDEAAIGRRRRLSEEAAGPIVQELLGAAEGHARLHSRAVCGEPVAVVLAEMARAPTDLLVIGKREPAGPYARHGAMGGVGFRVAYHAPTDVLVLSS